MRFSADHHRVGGAVGDVEVGADEPADVPRG